MSPEVWHLGGFSWDNETVYIYIDGILDSTFVRTKPVLYDSNQPFYIGKTLQLSTLNQNFIGGIDDIIN